MLLYEIPRCVYKEFLQQFPDENYVCEVSGKKPKFCTIAIWNRKECPEKAWTRQDDFRKGKAYYCNRFVELTIERGGPALRVLGVHAPCEDSSKKPEFEVDISEAGDLETLRDIEEAEIDEKMRKVKLKGDKGVYNFFKSLKQYAVAVQDKKEPFIIVGDLNVHEKEPSIYLAQIREIVNSGYSTEIKDGEITYFRNGHTIDHVLVSPELKDKVTARVIPRKVLELSDHAVIIVDVQLEP